MRLCALLLALVLACGLCEVAAASPPRTPQEEASLDHGVTTDAAHDAQALGDGADAARGLPQGVNARLKECYQRATPGCLAELSTGTQEKSKSAQEKTTQTTSDAACTKENSELKKALSKSQITVKEKDTKMKKKDAKVKEIIFELKSRLAQRSGQQKSRVTAAQRLTLAEKKKIEEPGGLLEHSTKKAARKLEALKKAEKDVQKAEADIMAATYAAISHKKTYDVASNRRRKKDREKKKGKYDRAMAAAKKQKEEARKKKKEAEAKLKQDKQSNKCEINLGAVPTIEALHSNSSPGFCILAKTSTVKLGDSDQAGYKGKGFKKLVSKTPRSKSGGQAGTQSEKKSECVHGLCSDNAFMYCASSKVAPTQPLNACKTKDGGVVVVKHERGKAISFRKDDGTPMRLCIKYIKVAACSIAAKGKCDCVVKKALYSCKATADCRTTTGVACKGGCRPGSGPASARGRRLLGRGQKTGADKGKYWCSLRAKRGSKGKSKLQLHVNSKISNQRGVGWDFCDSNGAICSADCSGGGGVECTSEQRASAGMDI